jgi:hypothetical protein
MQIPPSGETQAQWFGATQSQGSGEIQRQLLDEIQCQCKKARQTDPGGPF